MIGRTLSHFRITAKLGEGGMGEVFLAEDTSLDRLVALKILPERLAADPERLERFEREAKAIAALNHPNIVTIHSVEEADGVHLLTMELVEGESLDQILPARGFELDRLLSLAVQIAHAVAAAHEKGIVHRDLKPANVMVTDDGRVKVLDFGLAKLATQDEGAVPVEEDDETQLMTREGMVLGTVPYMSPEQVQALPVDHRSDVFSVGVLLHEMATGQRPFRGDNAASVLSAILKDEPARVTELKASLPNHLGRIVRRCLEKQPERRYQSAREITDASMGNVSDVVFEPGGDRIVFFELEKGLFLAGPPWPVTPSTATALAKVVLPDAEWRAVQSSWSWSPDGRLIAGRLRAGSRVGIGVYDPATGDGRLVRAEDGFSRLRWLPDSRRVVFFAEEGELAVLDVETGERRAVPVDLPLPLGHRDFAIAPDGTAIYYSGERIESNIWMVEPGR